MTEDARAADTPLGRYRLRTHELAPVLLPKARALSLPSPTSSERKEFTAVLPPARPRGSITRNPEASSARRGDPRAVSAFRHWLSQSFPQLLHTLQALGMTKTQSAESFAAAFAEHNEPSTNECRSPFDETEEEGADVAEDELTVDSEECWRLMLRHAIVLSATPSETLTLQNVTPAESVYFLLNGHCELSFRPDLVRDGKPPSTTSSLPRMSAITLACSDRPIMHLRELAAGDCFGLDAAAFGFECHISTATAGKARQRNSLGLRELALTYVLCLPYTVVQQLQLLQRRHHDNSDRLPPAFPYSFPTEAEVFLRNTFLFRAMTDSSRRFLAAHLHQVVVAQQEYLFTPGQPVRVFIVISGQLTLGDPREKHTGARKEADLELELLQAHDSVGLAEVLCLAPSFERYCAVTSANGARAYALPSTALLMVLAQESSSLKLVHEWISHRNSWFELRRATALAQRKKLVVEDAQHVLSDANTPASKATGRLNSSPSATDINDIHD
uniref:Cyclic nucleotide-binding domain-containing protein n=1 Tax=Phytophthora ramorum TaxID=164328 RepID=H3GGV0_PHYRM